jgi:hypothetical protein
MKAIKKFSVRIGQISNWVLPKYQSEPLPSDPACLTKHDEVTDMNAY